MREHNIVIDPPVKGNWVIYNPPGHADLAFDFLAADENRSLYSRGGFLRHLVSFIPVEDTYTWSSPVFSPVDGVVAASHDTEDDRKKISFAYDLISLMINKPKESDGFGPFGGCASVTPEKGFCLFKKRGYSYSRSAGRRGWQFRVIHSAPPTYSGYAQ
jgi:hypothetical protein